MRGYAAESVVKPVQVLAQDPDHLHADLAVFAQRCEELVARNQHGRRYLTCFRGDTIVCPAHTLTQPEHGSRAGHLQELLLASPHRQQQANLPALHQVNSPDWGTLLKQRSASCEALHLSASDESL